MGINDLFNLIGGLAMFLFGMNVMSHALEQIAGNQMKAILGKLTSNKMKGFLLGLGVTAIIQPGGSVRDEESIQACNEHGIAMVFTGYRHFRH